jgi:hypothetical protein
MAKLRRPDPAPPGRDVSDRPTRPAPDPRWLLSPHARRIAAHRFYLLTGESPDGRFPGSVPLGQGEHGEPTAEDVWTTYRGDLITESRSAGFEPHRLTHRTPTGAAFERWRAAFLRQHTY